MPGPTPKPPNERRRRNRPASQAKAASQPFAAASAPPTLGFAAHALVSELWASLSGSVEAGFYSAADWQRARLELFYINSLLGKGEPPRASEWATAQAGLSALLVSPAEKRRVGVELRPGGADPDEEASVRMLEEYRARLRGDARP